MILRWPGSAGTRVVGVGRVRLLLLGAFFLAFGIGFFRSYLEQLVIVSYGVAKSRVFQKLTSCHFWYSLYSDGCAAFSRALCSSCSFFRCCAAFC